MDVPLPDDEEELEPKPDVKPESKTGSEPESEFQPPPPFEAAMAHEATTTSSFVSDRTTLSCRAPDHDTSISQCAKNDPDPS